ncbi:hypothetical protein [Cyclobacterium xiamenense]|uniref:capsular polysaccharide export protein, LipB/KpsS family n=1 Tax=Cyclobacterium xiamenense TaxID=1297121 RepID=UPI0035D0A717
MKGIDRILTKYPSLKSVAFFHSHILWPSHFETELELMEKFQDKGIAGVNFVCNDVLKSCDLNATSEIDTCSKCIQIRRKGLRLAQSSFKSIPVKFKVHAFYFPKGISVDEFKSTHYKNFDVGYAVLSTIVSRYRDPYITIGKYRSEIEVLVKNAIGLYEFFVEQLTLIQPDLVVLFNGRYAYTRALLRACEVVGIKYFTHERGANQTKYMLFENTLPHDLAYFEKCMKTSWEGGIHPVSEKIEIAKRFYENRRMGKSQSWFSFTENQIPDLLPVEWNANDYNVVFFLSSEDEFIAIGDQWVSPLFTTQLDGLEYIFSKQADIENFKYYIRIHPNSRSAVEFVKKVSQLESDQIRIILPESPISTYQLLFNANKVVTFGSTVGIEAAFWGIPSINLGVSFYKQLNVTYNPASRENVIPMLTDRKLPPKNKSGTYRYAYHLSTFGYQFEIYYPESLMSGRYRGYNLQAIPRLSQIAFANHIKRPVFINRLLTKAEVKLRYYLHLRRTFGR